MVKPKEEFEITQEKEDEKKLYDEGGYILNDDGTWSSKKAKPTTDFDFAKGIVSGISGDENSMRALLSGKKDKIAQAGQGVSTAMFTAQIGNLAAGMVAGGIGNRAGGRAGIRQADPLEASKLLNNLPWYKNVPKGGIKGRKGRFEKASDKYTTKDLVEQIAKKYPDQKFSPELREALENSPALKNEVAKVNARPNYYRALGSVQVLTRAKTELEATNTKLKGEISQSLMESRGYTYEPGIVEKSKTILKNERDIKDLEKRIADHESDRVYYEKSEADRVKAEADKAKVEADNAKVEADKVKAEADKVEAIDILVKKRNIIETRLTELNRLLVRQKNAGLEGSPEYMKTYAEIEKLGRDLIKNESDGMAKDPNYMKLRDAETATKNAKTQVEMTSLIKERRGLIDEINKLKKEGAILEPGSPEANLNFGKINNLRAKLYKNDQAGEALDIDYVNKRESEMSLDRDLTNLEKEQAREANDSLKKEEKIEEEKVDEDEADNDIVESDLPEWRAKAKYDQERAARTKRELEAREKQRLEDEAEENERPDFGDDETESLIPKKDKVEIKEDKVEIEEGEVDDTKSGVKPKEKVDEGKIEKPGKPLTQPFPVLIPSLLTGAVASGSVPVAPSPAPAPTPAAPTIVASNTTVGSGGTRAIKQILDRKNIDELLQQALKSSTDVYDPEIGKDAFVAYYGEDQFDVPFTITVVERILYLAFRGTNSISNAITDIQSDGFGQPKMLEDYTYFQNILPGNTGKIEFHAGFIKTVLSSYGYIVGLLESIVNSYDKIVVTGHSLGGAVSQVFSYVYNNSIDNIFSRKPIRYVITFGQPRAMINNPRYLQKYEDSVPHFIRVWNTNDPVPYLPFKNKIFIDNTLGINFASGYTHVGNSFNLKENLSNNNINILLYELIAGTTSQLKSLLKEYSLDDTQLALDTITENKYLSLLTYCYFQNLQKVEVKKDISLDELENVNITIGREMGQVTTRKEKCDIVKPFGLADLLEANPIVDDVVDIETFVLSSLSAISVTGNKLFAKAHKLYTYQGYLDKLINKQIEERRSILDIVNDENYIFKGSKDKKDIEDRSDTPLSINMPNGIFVGEFTNYELIYY